MKIEAQQKAIQFRRDGWSISRIATELRVSKSSVSLWVKSVTLSADQQRTLTENSRRSAGFYVALGQSKRVVGNRNRLQYQGIGRQRAQESGFDLYLAGCMLYWGEGSKYRGSLRFTNSDPDMIRLFMKFLRLCFPIEDTRITVAINAHLNNGLTQKEIEEFWLGVTALDRSQLRKGIYGKHSSASKKLRRNLLYGTVCVSVHDTKVVQTVYGSINEYASVKSSKWL